MASNETSGSEVPIENGPSVPQEKPKGVEEMFKEMMSSPANVKDLRPSTTGLPNTPFESTFYGHFMNPMMAKMEETVAKNSEMLDEINKQMEEERIERKKKYLSRHIPELLQGNGQEMGTIMKTIQSLILYENYDKGEPEEADCIPARLKELDENAEVAVLSHSIGAFVSTLEPGHLKHLANRIVSDTASWLSKLFRFEDGQAFFHEEEREGMVRIARLAMHQKYEKFASDGYEALYTRPPVIYISAAGRAGLGSYLCSQLHLPESCICTVPLHRTTHKMDSKALEKLIEDDEASGKTPIMVIASAGTQLLGHVDNTGKIKEMCKKHNMWLHVEGNNIALLACYSVPTSVVPAKHADSISLNMGGWLGLPSVPYTTLFKSSDIIQVKNAGLSYNSAHYKLNCISLWICIQNMGMEGITDKIAHTMTLAKLVHERIEKIPTIKDVSKYRKLPPDPKEEKEEKTSKFSVTGLIGRAITALVVFEVDNPMVVFRYQKPEEVQSKEEDKDKKGEEEEEAEEAPRERDPYFDSLNIWLCETLRRSNPRVHISAIEVETEGVCVRFAPMETANVYDTRKEDVEAFLEHLDQQLTILDSTVKQRAEFQEIVEAQDNLRLATLPNWAGLGAVQYIPEGWTDKMDSLPEDGKKEINILNHNLVQQLKSADSAFSLGNTEEDLACVRFGLITEDTDLEELIALVYTTGKEVEESSKFIETMAEVIQKGIEKANEDLKKEQEDKLAQEGVLRQVPLVGSLLSWWSPPPKDQVKGRTFNLTSGNVASTEDTYKYHMQVQETNVESAPKQEGPLKNSLKLPKHRRSTSSTSSQSDSNKPMTSPTGQPINGDIASSPEVTEQNESPVPVETATEAQPDTVNKPVEQAAAAQESPDLK